MRYRPFFLPCANVTSQIELKAEDLYDKEKVDLETIVIDDVFKLLQCDENGLSQEEAVRRIELFGPNKLEVEEQNAFLQARHITSAFTRLILIICAPVVLVLHVESPGLICDLPILPYCPAL